MNDTDEPRSVDLSHALMDKIERAAVPFNGLSYFMKVVDVRGNRRIDPTAADITAETIVDGRSQRVTLHLGLARLDDDDYVVAQFVESMRQVLTGELPPGTRSLL